MIKTKYMGLALSLAAASVLSLTGCGSNSSEAKPTAYESVKEKIITSLKQQQFSAKISEVAKELKSKAKIVNMTKETNATQK
jgi:hypothetical protein